MAEDKVTKTTASAKKPPASAKKPQDHKPKEEAPKAKATEVEGGYQVELHGAEFFVANEALDDFELLDDLQSADRGQDATRLPSILRRLIGEEGYRTAMDVLRSRSENGRVTIEAGGEFIRTLFGSLDPN